MIYKPQIFVGSSKEAEEIDKIISSKIVNFDATPIRWNDSKTFSPGIFPLEALLEMASKVDGALLIATADDLIHYRGKKRNSPRDNIIFEMGIFFAKLGKPRTVIVRVRDKQKGYPELPSNLHGLTTLTFDPDFPDDFEKGLSNWVERVRNLRPKSVLEKEIISLLPKLLQTQEEWLTYLDRFLVSPFSLAADYMNKGEVLISIGDYYHSLYEETDAADSSTEIMAVTTLSSILWTQDKEQQQYIKKNINAANRGANISRIFIIQPKEWKDFEKVLELQRKSGIKVKFVDTNILATNRDLKDMAIFRNKKKNTIRIYIVDEVLGNPNRIYGAKLIIEPNTQKRLIEVFKNSWMISTDFSQTSFSVAFKSMDQSRTKAPGESLKVHKLDRPVVSCQEAASAKDIPLSNELKSTVLQTSMGIVCIHTSGNVRISLRAVKEALAVKEAYLASYEELNSLGLSPGTVSAVLEPVWSLPHLISRRLLSHKYVSTNNGTLQGYFKFDPKILLSSPNNKIADIEEPID